MKFFVIVFLSLDFLAVSIADSPLKLTLDDALRYATERNLEVSVLQKQQAVAGAEVTIARQFTNPDLIGEVTRSQPNYFVGAGYLFELGNKRAHRIEVARGESRAAQIEFQNALRSLRHDVRVSFYKTIETRQVRDQTLATKNLSQRLVDISRERFEAGGVPQIEVLQAELAALRAENELKTAESEIQISQAELNSLLNREISSALEPAGSLQDQTPPLQLAALIEKALASHGEVLAVEQEIRVETARLNLAKAERYPNLELEAGTEINDAEFQYGYRFGVRFGLPLLNFQTGEVAKSQAELERLKTEAEAVRRRVQSEITQAYLKLQAAQFQMQNYRDHLLPSALQIEKMSEESYREGKTGILLALDAQKSVREVRLEYLNASMNYQTALADLEKAVGAPLP